MKTVNCTCCGIVYEVKYIGSRRVCKECYKKWKKNLPSYKTRLEQNKIGYAKPAKNTMEELIRLTVTARENNTSYGKYVSKNTDDPCQLTHYAHDNAYLFNNVHGNIYCFKYTDYDEDKKEI